MEGLREGYEFYIKNSAAYVGGKQVDDWVEAIDAEFEKFAEDLRQYFGKTGSSDSIGGYIAETWHKGTFNIDAAIKESADRASTPKATELGSVDIHLDSGADYSLKYYKSADRSLKEQAKTFREKAAEGSSHAKKAIKSGSVAGDKLLYDEQLKLIPSDQLEDAKEVASRKVAKEQQNRPEQAERYRSTREQLRDRVSNEEGVESKPLTKRESRELAEDAKTGKVDLEKYGISKQKLVEFERVMEKSLKAGMSAAAVAAALSAAPTLLEAFEHLAETGEIDVDKLKETGIDTLCGSAKGFLTGASCAAIVGLAETGRFGEAFGSLDPSTTGAVAVVLVSTMLNAAKVASGGMRPAEMADSFVRDSFVAASSVALGTAGGAFGGVMAEALVSKVTGSIVQILLPQLPAIGYLLGSFVGSTVAGIAYGAGRNAFVALCVDSGFTAFGLVDQDYELSESMLREIGVDVFEYESFTPDTIEADNFEPDSFVPDVFVPDRFELTFVHRGVIGVARVGYVA